jgi:hypothetical protein
LVVLLPNREPRLMLSRRRREEEKRRVGVVEGTKPWTRSRGERRRTRRRRRWRGRGEVEGLCVCFVVFVIAMLEECADDDDQMI